MRIICLQKPIPQGESALVCKVVSVLINLKIDHLGNSSLIKMNGADACSKEATQPLLNLQVCIFLEQEDARPLWQGSHPGLVRVYSI